MDAELYRRVKQVIAEVLERELEGDELRQYVSKACGEDAGLLREVESLLDQGGASCEQFLEEPLVADVTIPERPARSSPDGGTPERVEAGAHSPTPTVPDLPEAVGPFRVLELLGEGGMGSVYLAEQDQPVHRELAVKVIRADVTATQAAARFDLERQTLARLSHPHIAQLYEAGTTAEGYPYFAMEHCSGAPVTDYCDQHRLSIEQRLELFISICEAVQHAHQRGIIHRDLKPSNILVTEVDGRHWAKIIDFGIAKAIDQPLAEAMDLTGERIVGTPAYMSPESLGLVNGVDLIDTRTDVYALGVVLYELLVGTRPFALGSGGLARFLSMVANEPTPRPSQRLSTEDAESREQVAELRQVEASTLHRRLIGDLDWIVATAVAKDREERYGSPAELAADVRRFLDHQPVTASPPSLRYLAGKFVRRHRGMVAAASLAVIALILGTIGTTFGMMQARWEAERAREALLDAEEVTDFLVHLFEVSDPREAGGETISARQLLDRGAVRIEERLAGQPLRQARLMHSIGDIYDQLQVYTEAKGMVSSALALREQELPADHQDIAESLYKLGVIERELAEYEAAEEVVRRSLEIRQDVFGPDHPLVGEALRELAVTLYLSGRHDEAEPLVRRSLEIATTRLDADDPAVASSLETLGNLLKDRGRQFEAIPFLQQALAIREQALDASDPRLATSLNNLGSCLGSEQRFEEALPLFERALVIQEKTLGPSAPPVAMSRANLGIVYRELDQFDEAESAFVRAQADFESALGPTHPLVANPMAELGVLFWQQGRMEDAEKHLRQALGMWIKVPGPDHPLTAWAHWGLANVLRDSNQPNEAETHYKASLEVREKVLPTGHPELVQTLEDYARLLRDGGRVDEAAVLEEQAKGASD